MPAVPRLQGQSILVNPRPTPTVSPDAFGASIGQAVGQVGGDLAKIAEEERQDAIRVQSNEALVRLRTARDRMLYDRDTGVLNRQRLEAREAPEMLDREWRSQVSQIAASIRDQDARRNFEERAMVDRAEVDSMVLRHVSQELDRADVEATKGLVDGLANDAVAMALEGGDAKIVEREALLRSARANRGKAPEALEAELANDRSRIRASQVASLIAGNQLTQASALFERVKGELNADDTQRVQRALSSETRVQEVQRIRDDVTGMFPDSEAEALKYVRDNYSGEVEEGAAQAVRVHYAEQRRLRNEDIKRYSEEAMNAVDAGREIPQGVRVWLEQNNQGTVLKALRDRQTQIARGEPTQTDWRAFQELSDMLETEEGRRQFRDINLLDYADRLADTDMRAFMNAQSNLSGAQRTIGTGLTPTAITNEAFAAAAGRGLLGGVRTMAQLQGHATAKNRFNEIQSAVMEAISLARQENGAPLNQTQIRDVMTRTLDEFTLEDKGMLSREQMVRRPAVPSATTTPDVTTPLSPQAEARTRALIQSGVMSESEIVRILRAEGLLSPTP